METMHVLVLDELMWLEEKKKKDTTIGTNIHYNIIGQYILYRCRNEQYVLVIFFENAAER